MKRNLCIIIAIILSVFLILQAGGLTGIKVGIKADDHDSYSWQFISGRESVLGESYGKAGDNSGVMRLIIDPANARHMILICWHGHFRESFDGGKTWANIPFSKFGGSFETDDMATSDVYYVNGVWYFDGPIFDKPGSIHGIYKTKDFATFEEICSNVNTFWTDGLVFYKGMPSGPGSNNNCFFVSKDGSANWDNLSNGVQQALQDYKYSIGVSKIIVFKGKIFVEINNRFWLYSLDNGNSFQKLGNSHLYFHLCSVAGRLWLVEYDDDKTIIKESEDGISWQILTDKAPIRLYNPLNDIIWDPISGVFIMASDINMHYSINGKSWIPDSAGLEIRSTMRFNCLALSEQDKRVYLFFGEELYFKNLPLTIRKHVVLRINDKQIIANGKEIIMETAPVINNDRTFLPIRYISEPLGAQVQWNATERKATVSLGSTIIELWIGKSIAKVNGVNTPIDQNSKVVPYIDSGRTMLPLRFISENLGCIVYWDQLLRLVTIVYPKDE